jgi:autotransporter-associated beta strand protein
LCAVAAAGLVLATCRARAGVAVEWDTGAADGIQGGPGGWTANVFWNDGGVQRTWSNVNGDTAVFGGTPGGTVTLTSAVTAAAVRVDAPGYQLGAAASPTLTLSTGSFVANADVVLRAPLAAPAGVGLYKSGPGTLTLTGTNTLLGLLRVSGGTLGFAGEANLGPVTNDVHLSAGGALRYAGTATLSLNLNRTITVDAAGGGAIDTPSGALSLGANGHLAGAGVLEKRGGGRLQLLGANVNFTGEALVTQGTLNVDHPQALNGRPVTLAGGAVAFRGDSEPSTSFGSDVTVTADAAVEADTSLFGFAEGVRAIRDLSVAPAATITVRASQSSQLAVRHLSLLGNMVIDDAGLRVTGTVSGPGAIQFGSQARPAATFLYGLIFEAGGAAALANPIEVAPAPDARAQVAVGAGTVLTYAGTWDAGAGGGGTAANNVALRGGSAFVVAAAARLNTTTPDVAAARPLIVTAAGADDAFELTHAFVADRTLGGTVADGFSALEMRGGTLRTRATASLPAVVRQDGFGGTHRAGSVVLGGSAAARWEVVGGAQVYDGRVTIDAPATTIRTDADLAHAGVTSARFDGQFEIPAAGAVLTKDGPGTLTLAGAQGYAPGAAMRAAGGVLRFDSDPGGGWYAGNFTRGADGHVAAPPAPAGTLAVTAGAGAALEFATAVARVASLNVEAGGTARVSASPTSGARTLVTNALTIAQGGRLDVANNRLVLDYDPADGSPLAAVAGSIKDGHLVSSTAASIPSYGVGFGEAAAVLRLTGDQAGTFGGAAVDATSVLVRYTLLGDANLDGVVNFSDFQRFERGFGRPSQSWVTGDFDYNGIVDTADFLLLYRNFDHGGNPSAAATLAAFAAQVPEPSWAWTAGAAAFLLRRRKYVNTR